MIDRRRIKWCKTPCSTCNARIKLHGLRLLKRKFKSWPLCRTAGMGMVAGAFSLRPARLWCACYML